jgi:hypothetical protein
MRAPSQRIRQTKRKAKAAAEFSPTSAISVICNAVGDSPY